MYEPPKVVTTLPQTQVQPGGGGQNPITSQIGKPQQFGKFSKFRFRKNIKLKIILPIIFLVLAVAAVVAGMVLVQSDQDLRQQAAGTAGYSCGDATVMFIKRVTYSVPCSWSGRTFYKCADGFRNAGTRQSPNCVARAASSPITLVSCTSYANGADLFSNQVTGSSACSWRGAQRFQCSAADGYHYANGACVNTCNSEIGLFREYRNNAYQCLFRGESAWECRAPYVNLDNQCVSLPACTLEGSPEGGLFFERKDNADPCLSSFGLAWQCTPPYINSNNQCELP